MGDVFLSKYDVYLALTIHITINRPFCLRIIFFIRRIEYYGLSIYTAGFRGLISKQYE